MPIANTYTTYTKIPAVTRLLSTRVNEPFLVQIDPSSERLKANQITETNRDKRKNYKKCSIRAWDRIRRYR